MFSRALAIALLALPFLAAAHPPNPPSSCSTGPVQCCNSVESSNSPAAADIISALGIVLDGVTKVGLTCSPINVIGAGGGKTCSSNTVCCKNNSYGGLISIGCAPVSL